MPLQKQPVEVRLGKLDTKTSSKLAVPGTITLAQNLKMVDTNRFDRRHGFTTEFTQADVNVLFDYKDEFLLASADTLYSRYGGATTSKGSLTSFDARYEPVDPSSFNQVSADMVITNGQRWTVWMDVEGGIKYSVQDHATGAYIVTRGSISPGGTMFYPRIFAVGTNVLVTYVDVSGGLTGTVVLAGRKIAVASPASVGSQVTIDAKFSIVGSALVLANWDKVSGYDGVVISSTEVVLAYVLDYFSGGTDTRVAVHKWNVSTMTSTIVFIEFADANCMSGGVAIIGTSGGYTVVQCASDTTNNVRLIVVNSALTVDTTNVVITSYGVATTLRAITGYVDGSGTAHIFVERARTAGATTRQSIEYWTRTSGGTVAQVDTRYGFSLASHPFTSGGVMYLLVSAAMPDGSLQVPGSLLIMNATSGVLAGRPMSQLSSVDSVANLTGRLLPVPQVSGSEILCAADYYVTGNQIGTALVRFTAAARTKWVEACDVVVIPGSWPRIYDGRYVSNLGFEGVPRIVQSTTGASGYMADGLFYYKAHWEGLDAQGRVHQGPVSPAYAHTTSGGSGSRSVALIFEGLSAAMSAVFASLVLKIYRTVANPSADDVDNFNLVGSVRSAGGAVSASFTDTMTDADLINQPILYTTGANGAVQNSFVPPCTDAEAHGNRLWLANGTFLECSKEFTENDGIQFTQHANFRINVDDRCGDFVALVSAGHRLLAFKRGGIYAVTGAGPDNAGVGTFPPVDRLELPLGARSEFAVLGTELGVFFQDDQTGQIWLIGDNGAEYIGAPVEDVATTLTFTNIVEVGTGSSRQVRFHTAVGTTLVYDLFHKQWFVWTGQIAAAAASIVLAGSTAPLAYYVSTNGNVRYEDPTTFLDGGSTYQGILELAWLSFAGLSGYQRIYAVIALGEALGAHTLTMQMTYKFGTATESKSVASSALSAAHGFRVKGRPSLAYQKSTSIKIRLSDNSPSTAGFGLEALTVVAGIDRKAARLPAAHNAA